MFDWDRFENKKIAVHCDTEEKAKDFLKECSSKGMTWGNGDSLLNKINWEYYKESTYYRLYDSDTRIYFGNVDWDESKNIEIIKWEVKEMKELTFKEVIANIKENEVWECRNPINGVFISKDVNGISIRDKKGNSFVWFSDLWIFKLQRKEYTFEEAFKAYEEGKEVESFKGISYIKHYEEEYNEEISIEEIRGKWYIND